MADNNINSVFEIKDLVFSYEKGTQILKGVSMQVEKGRITSVIGSNGCGKSTLFHLLCGLLKPDSGEILLNGEKTDSIPKKEFAKMVSIVHQYNTAPDDLTVRKLVALGRTPYHSAFSSVMSDEDRAAVNYALEITDTEKYAERPVLDLSGGQRQRVWLAMALAQKTDVLLLDEITTYLDVYYQLQLLGLIRDLNREHGITILMVLHDINEAIKYSDNAIVLKGGCLLDQGPAADVLNEENLHEAFGINTSIKEIDGQRICIYE